MGNFLFLLLFMWALSHFFFSFVILSSKSFTDDAGDHVNEKDFELDSDFKRYKLVGKTKQSLLIQLNSYFSFSGEKNFFCIPPIEISKLAIETPQVDPNCKSPEALKLWEIPDYIQQIIIEKYLNTKDSINFSYTCKYFNGIVQGAAETNLSLFCPHFVLPDLQLNRIFYFGILKDLRVDNLKDPKIHDAFQLYHIQQLVLAADSKPVSKEFEPILAAMRVFLYEIVHGLNCRIPDSEASHFEHFQDFIQIYSNQNSTMTLDYIQSLPESNKFKVEFQRILKVISCSPDQLRLTMQIFERGNNFLWLHKLPLSVLKLYVQHSQFDSEIYTDLEIFEHLLRQDIFIPGQFDKLILAGNDLSGNKTVLRSFNMNLALRLIKRDEPGSARAHYILTRTAIEPFDNNHFSTLSVSGDKYFLLALSILIHHCKHNLNLAHLNTLLQIFRHRIVDLTRLDAPHRTFILKNMLKSDGLDIILNMFKYEKLSPINLFIRLPGDTRFCPIGRSDESFIYPLYKKDTMEAVIQYLLSQSDDPLPLLLLPLLTLRREFIQNKFNLNKKYLFDYDRNQISFLESNYAIKIEHGSVVDFKTIIKKMHVNCKHIYMTYFTSDTKIFDEPTPEEVRPISLKCYFENAIFEEINL